MSESVVKINKHLKKDRMVALMRQNLLRIEFLRARVEKDMAELNELGESSKRLIEAIGLNEKK